MLSIVTKKSVAFGNTMKLADLSFVCQSVIYSDAMRTLMEIGYLSKFLFFSK